MMTKRNGIIGHLDHGRANLAAALAHALALRTLASVPCECGQNQQCEKCRGTGKRFADGEYAPEKS